MATVYDVARDFRDQLQQLEDAATFQMAAQYAAISQQTTRRIDDFAEKIAQRLEAGQNVPVSWLFQEGRLRDLRTDVDAAMREWAQRSYPAARNAVDAATSMGPTAALEMVRASMPGLSPGLASSLVRMRQDEIEQIVGSLVDGSPLRELLRGAALERASDVERALVEGVAAARDPRAVARDIGRDILGGPPRARTIVRTEMLRTTREAQRQSYESTKMVSGWIWWSSLDARACPVCWAMHGTRHELDEVFGSHPNCRCSMLPETFPPEILGLPFDPIPDVVPGVERFAGLQPARQLAILGPSRFKQYQEGTQLGDMVRFRQDPRWGPTRGLKPIRPGGSGGAPPVVPPAPAPAPAPTPAAAPAAAPAPAAPAPPTPTPVLPDDGSIRDRLGLFNASRGTKKEVRAGVDRAIETIDKYLRVPDSGVQPMLSVDYKDSRGIVAAYVHLHRKIDNGFVRSYMEIGPSAARSFSGKAWKQPDLTFIHEFSHYMDYEVLHGTGSHGSAALRAGAEAKKAGVLAGQQVANASAELADWYAAANTQGLRDRVSSRFFPGSREYNYFLSPDEMFARSMEQWFVRKTGDPELLRAMREAPTTFNYGMDPYWTDAEFDAVEQALDDYFRKKGMLR